MAVEQADYELPATAANGQRPEARSAPLSLVRPTVQTLSVTLKRQVWTERPRGTYEVAVSATCEPDRSQNTPANLDALHGVLRRRLDDYLDGYTPCSTPNGGA
jgi:hypothetical protein